MKRVGAVIEKLADLSGYVSGWMVPIMVALVAMEVFTRYVLRNPTMVADEFSAYLLVALSYMGLAYTWRQGGHVRITILVNWLPERAAAWIRLIVLIMIFIFMIGMTQAGFKMVLYAHQINLRSDTWLIFPLVWPQLTVLIGFLTLTLTVLLDIAKAIAKIRVAEPAEEKLK